MAGTEMIQSTAHESIQLGKLARQMEAAKNLEKAPGAERAREVATEFEAMFLSQMLQPMFENVGAEEPFGGGPAEKMWRSLMVDEYGKAMAKAGGIGLADEIYREILKTQEVN